MFTARQLALLHDLLSRDDYIPASVLANRLSVSTRTLSRELDALKPALKKARLSVFNKKGAGLLVTGAQKDKDALLASLEETPAATQNKTERRMLLGVDLLKAAQAEKLLFYASRYEVSEATISHDLDLLEEDLAPFQVSLIRKPGLGIAIEGSETARRQALSWLSAKALDIAAKSQGFDRYNVQDVLRSLTSNAATPLKEVLRTEILQGILEVFEENKEELELESMAMASYTGLLIHLVIVIDRLQKHITLSDNEAMQSLVKDKAAARKARLICSLLAHQFDIRVDPAEEAFIAVHLQAAKAAAASAEDFSENMDLIYTMLQVFKDAGFNLFGDNELIQSLSAHLSPALVRIECALPITNPLLDQIQQQFPQVYGLAALAGKAMEEKTGLVFNADEIGYITLHFAAALERNRSKAFRKIRVGVVCASGIGLSSLLCARLRQCADSEVEIKALSIEQAKTQPYDLLVSSFQLPGALVVHPILQKEDEQNFQQALQKIRSHPDFFKQNATEHMDISTLVLGLGSFIQSIQVLDLPEAETSKDVIHTLAHTAALSLEQMQALEQAVLAREALASNVFDDLHLALFHAALPEVEMPVLLLARPGRNAAWDQEMKEIHLAVLMAMNSYAPHWQQDLLSSFSAMLVEDPAFFELLQKESIETIRLELERRYQNWLVSQLKKLKF